MDEVLDRTRYVLIVRLPRQVEVRIEDAYLSLAGSTRPVMGYHISLLGPFYLLGEEALQVTSPPEDVLPGVATVCQRWQSFRLHIAGLGTFASPDDNLVYLHVVGTEQLVALHQELLDAVRGQVIPQSERYRESLFENYVPHVTLGLRLSDRELRRFLALAATRIVDEAFDVTRLWLAEQRPHGPWRYVADYSLGGG